MAIPTIPVYTGGVANPDGSQDQQEFTTNMFNQLSYEATLAQSLNNTVNEMNMVAGQADTNAAIAQNSADAAQASANFEGEFVVGVTNAEKGKSYSYDGEVWLCLQNTTSTPSQGSSEWKLSVGDQYVTTAQGDVLGGKLFKGSNGETVENGDTVPTGTTHLRILVGGKPTIVAISPIASGTVSLLTDTGATIGVVKVSFADWLSEATLYLNAANSESSYRISERLSETRRIAVRRDSVTGLLYVSIVSQYLSNALTPSTTVWTIKEDDDGIWDILSIVIGEATEPAIVDSAPTIAGSGWITGAPPNYYTTTVGDSYKVENVYCDTISVSHFADNRGGDFIAYLFDSEGNLIKEKRYTTYRETSVTRETVILFDSLPLATYSVYVEFVGENKLYPPSGGVARGWIHSTGGIRTSNSMEEFTPDPATATTIMSSSVLVYAIQAKPEGSSAASSWVPVHSGQTGVSQNVTTKAYVDNLVLDGLVTLIPEEFTECKYLKIQQRYTAYNFTDQSVPMWEGQTSMSFTEKGMVYDHTIEFLNDTFVSSGYMSMLPARGDFFSGHRCIGSLYGDVNTVDSSGSNSLFPSMGNSIFYGGELLSGREVCFSLYNAKHANLVGAPNPYSANYQASGLLTNRVDSVSKFYTYACRPGATIPSGAIWSASNYYDVTLLVSPMSGSSVF